jgi:CHASE1-domain containing sensor protein
MSTVLKDAFSVTRLSFWTGALLSSLIGSSLYLFTQRSIEGDAHERFVNHARSAQSVIEARVKSYTDLLRGAGSMIQSVNSFNHHEFHEYVRRMDLKKNFPAVDTINYAVQVTDAQLPGLLARLRQEMGACLPREGRIEVMPKGERPEYLIVSYIEPDADLASHYGLDLMANRYFGSQLLQARDSGTMHAAGTPIIPLSHPNDNHLGMRMPIYRPDAPLATVEQRRAAYAGSIGLAFSLPKLLHGVLDELPMEGVRMTLYDTGKRIDILGRDSSGRPLIAPETAAPGRPRLPDQGTGTQAHRPRDPRRPRPEPAGPAHRDRIPGRAHQGQPRHPAQARPRHPAADRHHHQERAPDHQRPASDRARPRPVRRCRVAGQPVPAPHRHPLPGRGQPRRDRPARPLRHRLLPHPAGVADQHRGWHLRRVQRTGRRHYRAGVGAGDRQRRTAHLFGRRTSTWLGSVLIPMPHSSRTDLLFD